MFGFMTDEVENRLREFSRPKKPIQRIVWYNLLANQAYQE